MGKLRSWWIEISWREREGEVLKCLRLFLALFCLLNEYEFISVSLWVTFLVHLNFASCQPFQGVSKIPFLPPIMHLHILDLNKQV